MADIREQKRIREINTEKILTELLKNGEMTRLGIAANCGVSPATVTQVITPLLEHHVVEETEAVASSGGRKPVLLRIVPDYGCVVVFRILRSGVTANVFDLQGQVVLEKTLSDCLLKNDRLYQALIDFVLDLRENHEAHGCSDNVIQIGLLLQDDLGEDCLAQFFSTEYSSEPVPLEYSLSAKLGIPVVKERIESYSLSYHLDHELTKAYQNYAYIHAGDFITANITLAKKQLKVAGETIFDVTPLLSETELMRNVNKHLRQYDTEEAPNTTPVRETEYTASSLARIIRILCVLFPLEILFLGGEQLGDTGELLRQLRQIFAGQPQIDIWGGFHRSVPGQFAKTLLERSVRIIVRQARA